ncbi:hypothetical protein HK405_005688 [Cladochytrium tenue]|nr:hypothetical protein HK405_005688 [Cladochytrium tenue]
MVESYPLLAAAANNYPGIFDQLVHSGHTFPTADVLKAQYITAGRGHVEMMKRLLALSKGELDKGALIGAIYGSQDEMVGFLLSRIDDLYSAYDDVDLALVSAFSYVSDDTVRAIIAKSRVDLSKDGNKFLHAAIRACRFALITEVFLPDSGVAALLPATNTFAFAGGYCYDTTDILRCIAATLGPSRLKPLDILGALRNSLYLSNAESCAYLLSLLPPGTEIPEDIVRLAARHNEEGVRALFPVPRTEATLAETSAQPVEVPQTPAVSQPAEPAELPSLPPPGPDGHRVLLTFGARRLDQIDPDASILVGLASSGLRSNVFSLVRCIVDAFGLDYASRCPWDPSVSRRGSADAHEERSSSQSSVEVSASHFPTSPAADSSTTIPGEMVRTFNCGISMVLVVDRANATPVSDLVQAAGSVAIPMSPLTCVVTTVAEEDRFYLPKVDVLWA